MGRGSMSHSRLHMVAKEIRRGRREGHWVQRRRVNYIDIAMRH